MSEKTRYSDAELEEFRQIINEKLEKAYRDYDLLKASIMNTDGNDVTDTSPTFKVLEEGASTLSKEEAGQLAQRQMKFIQHLQAALVRIENKTYGICRETGVRFRKRDFVLFLMQLWELTRRKMEKENSLPVSISICSLWKQVKWIGCFYETY